MATIVAAWPGASENQTGGRLFPSLGTVSGSADMASECCDDDRGSEGPVQETGGPGPTP